MRYRKAEEATVSGEAMTRIVVMLTLAAALGAIGFLAAGAVARSATPDERNRLAAQDHTRPDPGELAWPYPLPVRQGQIRQERL
jgi:hypothetical protein